MNNKKIEIAIKQIVSSGKPLTPSGTVANPESFQEYYKFYDIEALGKSRVAPSVPPTKPPPKANEIGKEETAGRGRGSGTKAKL